MVTPISSSSRAMYSLNMSSATARFSVSLGLLGFLGGDIERRHDDVGDAEHDLLARPARHRRCRARPCGCGRSTSTAADESGAGVSARLMPAKRLHGQLVGLGDLRERRSGLELVQDFGRLGLQARRDLLLAPARLDLLLDLVERAIARRGDAGDLEPHIAAIELQRIALGADFGGKCRRQQPLRIGHGDGQAGGRAPGPVDGLDRARRELERLGGFGQRLAVGAGVLDLVVELEDVGLGALERRARVLSSGATSSNGRTCSGSILRTCTSAVPKRPCTGALTSPSLSAKAASADRAVDDRRFGQRAEIDVLLGQAALLGDRRRRSCPWRCARRRPWRRPSFGKTICWMCRRSGVT